MSQTIEKRNSAVTKTFPLNLPGVRGTWMAEDSSGNHGNGIPGGGSGSNNGSLKPITRYTAVATYVSRLVQNAHFPSIRKASDAIHLNHVTLSGIVRGVKPTEESIDKIAHLARLAIDGDGEYVERQRNTAYQATRNRLRILTGYLPDQIETTDSGGLDSAAELRSFIPFPAPAQALIIQLMDALAPEVTRVPIVTRQVSGTKLLDPVNIEDHTPIARTFLPDDSGQLFAFPVSGAAMAGAGIHDGDLLIAREAAPATLMDNELVVGRIGEMLVVRRLVTESKQRVLEGQPTTGPADRVVVRDDVALLGLVVSLVRRLY